MIQLPRYNLLYFKNLLDIAFIDFFQQFNEKFTKGKDDKYYLCQDLSQEAIENFFMKAILRCLKRIVQPFDIVESPNYYLIIGACQPIDNYLLKFKDYRFPAKLSKIVYGDYKIKYILKEKDIVVDIVKFNDACCNVFNQLFLSNKKTLSSMKNVVFLTHKNLDCYSLFKIIKSIVGKSNCINLKKQILDDVKSPIIAVNDLVDKYVFDKQLANSDEDFKDMFNEIRQFIELKLQQM